MKDLLHAETTLMLANRSNQIAIVAIIVLLLLSAIWSGMAARELRDDQFATTNAAQQLIEQTRRDVETRATLPPQEAAMRAFLFGRSDAAPALLPGGGGLALSVSRFALLTPEARVSVDSRLTDGRRGEGLDNPLLAGLGQLDLAITTAIFVPLAALVLCAGMVQRERMLGIWRALGVQASSPLLLLGIRLLVRAITLALITAIASLPAFLIDGGATLQVTTTWFCLTTVYVAVWVAISGALCLMRTTSATALTTGLAIWIVALFMLPTLLSAAAEHRHPTTSRLQSIVELRASHLQFEEQEQALLTEWYAANPAWQPPENLSHTWPITFMPRHAAFDRKMRPVMHHFDNQRAARFNWLRRYAWISPPLALVMAADGLAGIDVPRHTRFVHATDQFEDQWRALIVPRVMSYRGLTLDLFSQFPSFEPPALSTPVVPGTAWWGLGGIFCVAIIGLWFGRARLWASC